MNQKKRLAYIKAKNPYRSQFQRIRYGLRFNRLTDQQRKQMRVTALQTVYNIQWRDGTTPPETLANYIGRWLDPEWRFTACADPRKTKRMKRLVGMPCKSFHPACSVCASWGLLLATCKFPSFQRVMRYVDAAPDEEINF